MTDRYNPVDPGSAVVEVDPTKVFEPTGATRPQYTPEYTDPIVPGPNEQPQPVRPEYSIRIIIEGGPEGNGTRKAPF